MIQTCNPMDTTLWYPGKKLQGFQPAQLSARAQEIARSREELLKLIQDLPDSEFELSFSDLVDKSEDKSVERDGESEGRQTIKIKERKKRTIGNGFGSNGNGVFLKVYMPASLTRSLTASNSCRRKDQTLDCAERERNPVMFGCLPALWVGKKSRKQQLAGKNK